MADKPLTARFTFDRETKNTYRFAETGKAPIIGTLYVAKLAMPDGPASGLTVAIQLDATIAPDGKAAAKA